MYNFINKPDIFPDSLLTLYIVGYIPACQKCVRDVLCKNSGTLMVPFEIITLAQETTTFVLYFVKLGEKYF